MGKILVIKNTDFTKNCIYKSMWGTIDLLASDEYVYISGPIGTQFIQYNNLNLLNAYQVTNAVTTLFMAYDLRSFKNRQLNITCKYYYKGSHDYEGSDAYWKCLCKSLLFTQDNLPSITTKCTNNVITYIENKSGDVTQTYTDTFLITEDINFYVSSLKNQIGLYIS